MTSSPTPRVRACGVPAGSAIAQLLPGADFHDAYEVVVDHPERTALEHLLVALAGRAGTVVTREQLMAEVWDVNWFGSTKTLDVHVGALRRKLGDDPAAPRWVQTVRGVGFRFAEDESAP